MTVAAAITRYDRNALSHPQMIARPQPILGTHRYIGILGVLLGSIISIFAGCLTAFGLADIRDAMHAGFEEGAFR